VACVEREEIAIRQGLCDLVIDSRSANSDVLDDLREQNQGAPPWAFEPTVQNKKRWTGVQPEFAQETEFDAED